MVPNKEYQANTEEMDLMKLKTDPESEQGLTVSLDVKQS